jgi:hypothetical protein
MPPQTPPAPQAPVPQPAAPAPSAPTPATPVNASKKGMPKWLKIVLISMSAFFVIVSILVFVIIKFVGNATADAVKVSDQAINAIQANDPDALYALLSEAGKKGSDQTEVTEETNRISPLLQGDESITARSAATNNGVATVTVDYQVTTSGGTKYIRIVLQKESGAWKVYQLVPSDVAFPSTSTSN